jgi:galactokinase
MTDPNLIAECFRAKFGGTPRLYRAPGRVNLIGEHTDYNDGFVMPVAIGFYCWAAIGPRNDRKLHISSREFPEDVEVDLSSEAAQPSHTWSDYPVGVAVQLQKTSFPLTAANVLIHGEVPIGAGLSSSASIEVATAMALAETSRHAIDRRELALICQRAETDFVGMKCGIMDQFISLCGRKSHALMLDCRSLQFELVSIPDSAKLVICNTGVKHKHAGGEYNRRREECEAAVRALKQALPSIDALRDVRKEDLDQHRALLSEVALKRARHVVSENARVLEAATALRAGDLPKVGATMNESHKSLRDDYEVSCAELDLMVDLAHQQQGVYGARMTGGGFGGSTVNLVDARHADAFAQNIAKAYRAETNIAPQIYVCDPVDGAGSVQTNASARERN